MNRLRSKIAVVVTLLFVLAVATNRAQQVSNGDAARSPVFDSYVPGPCSPTGALHGGCNRGELHQIRVVTVATGLVRPWHISFLPDGRTMLVTELPGRLRIIRNGTLDPQPIAGWPPASLQARGLNSVVVHPGFAQNHFVYLSYLKGADAQRTTVAIARGRLDGTALSEVREIFVADAWGTGAPAGRAEFGPDGMLYLTVGDRDRMVFTDNNAARILAQDLGSHVGKVLRLHDDGTAPPDNPFVARAGAKPEIYTYGHRNVHGLAWHPQTGALWAVEIGPMGGDELNVLRPGLNYGWPLVSFGKIYTGNTVSEQSWWRSGIEMPTMFWMPAISPSSLTFYTGDRFPAWKGHLFIGALSGQQVQRVAFNQPLPQQERRESLLTQLDVRFRDVRQGPDGYLYFATERQNQNGPGSAQEGVADGTILRLEPAQ
jgi:aldose sugar dehydrogenase